MPYKRKGNCVYLKTTGKNVGCSSSPEKAKRYLRALHANVHETFDQYVQTIIESLALGLIGFTNEDGTVYSYIHDRQMTHYLMITRKVNISGDSTVLSSINKHTMLDVPNILQWRYNFNNKIVYIWRGTSPKSKLVLDNLKFFFERKGWEVKGVKYLHELDTHPESERDFNDAHFM